MQDEFDVCALFKTFRSNILDELILNQNWSAISPEYLNFKNLLAIFWSVTVSFFLLWSLFRVHFIIVLTTFLGYLFQAAYSLMRFISFLVIIKAYLCKERIIPWNTPIIIFCQVSVLLWKVFGHLPIFKIWNTKSSNVSIAVCRLSSKLLNFLNAINTNK